MFTLMMNDVLGDLDFVLIFMDDVLVFSKTTEEHHSHLRQVLQRIRESHLYASPKKCEFYGTSAEYLGRVDTPEGVTAMPTKISAIPKWPEPRQFLGLAGYYRHFIHRIGHIAAPLTDVLGFGPWHWNSRHQQAFDDLRNALIQAPVLAFPDPQLPFVVGTDASDYAIGAVLQQDQGKGLQPLAFLSRKLTPAQRNYRTHEKEMLAIIEALKMWRHHLQGADYTVQVLTDHVTLKCFHRQPRLNPRQVRWMELLADFDLQSSTSLVEPVLPRLPGPEDPI
jgi:hypothetical protein